MLFVPISIPVLLSQYEKCSTESTKACFLGTVPIISWISEYKQDDFIGDLISGCTVAIMHIPQGMGYALLGNLPPVVGIYMAFFPVLLYVIFGTSRHNSMGMKQANFDFKFCFTKKILTGTFAVVSIMVGKCVNKYSVIPTVVTNSTDTQTHTTLESTYSPIEIATLVCFMVGVIQVNRACLF